MGSQAYLPSVPPRNVWSPDLSLLHEPPAPLLFHEEFQRGGNQVIDGVLTPGNPPSAQRWEQPAPAGLANWNKWSPSNPAALVEAWVDTDRKQGIVMVNAPLVLDAFNFAGMYLPFPTPPSYPFRVIVYSRIGLGRSFRTLDGVNQNFGGLFCSFAAMPADGQFVSVGFAQSPTGLAAYSGKFTDSQTLAAPLQLYPTFSPYVRLRIACNSAVDVSVQADISCDVSGAWWNPLQLFTGFTSLPTAIGIGGASKGIAFFQEGMVVEANYIRGYDGSGLVAGSFSTNGGIIQQLGGH